MAGEASNAVSRVCYLVSPPFACGVAWLVNALLELGIRTTHATFRDRHWTPTGRPNEAECEASAAAHLRWHLPVLHDRTRFVFDPSVEVMWEHRLDFALQPGRPAILFVRDPRDALYSTYRRHYQDVLSLGEYLRRPDVFPDHFPGMFGLPPIETWTYFNLFWRELGAEEQVHVERFEDARTDPPAALRRVLAMLRCSRNEAEIQRAVERSTFARAQEAMHRQAAATGKTFQTVRRGLVGEWAGTYTREDLAAFHPAVREAMQTFGYGWDGEGAAAGTPRTIGVTYRLPGVMAVATDAQTRMASGDARGAEATLKAGLTRYTGIPSASIALASELLALRWIQCMRADGAGSPRMGSILRILSGLNTRFADVQSVQMLLRETLEPVATGGHGWSG